MLCTSPTLLIFKVRTHKKVHLLIMLYFIILFPFALKKLFNLLCYKKFMTEIEIFQMRLLLNQASAAAQ